MSYMQEYLNKRWNNQQLIDELVKLIQEYNDKYSTYLVVYATDKDKDAPLTAKMLSNRDYQVLFDMLKDTSQDSLDFYVETPGGSGEAAEDIVKLTRRNFKKVHFIIAGEAKSAGTLMVLSGNEISMTDSGSLGPIDAQMGIGRTTISAHDYMDWVKTKQKAYDKKREVSPFDAIMIAQISPGELVGVENALQYAHDLVVEWLPKYKFSEWEKTETSKKIVTEQMKKKRAREIAEALSNHTTWRTHGRSLKIDALQKLGLKINCIDENKDKAELVYRINTVIRMIFIGSPTFKMFVTADAKLFENANPVPVAGVPLPGAQQQLQQSVEVIEVGIGCANCKRENKYYAKFVENPEIDKRMRDKGIAPLPKTTHVPCKYCKTMLELEPLRKQLEAQARKKVL